MRKVLTWLSTEPQILAERLELLLLALCLDLIEAVSMASLWVSGDAPVPADPTKGTRPFDFYDFALLVQHYIGVAVSEEIVFRLIPLKLAWWIGRGNKVALFLTAGLSSIAFGYIHGGWKYVSVQGVGGALYSIIYLKFGGIRGKALIPLAAVSTLHFGTDTILALTARLL